MSLRRSLGGAALVAGLAGVVVAAWLGVPRLRRPSPPIPPGVRANLLLVTIDTLRADRASPDLMPNLTALAAAGTRGT